MCKICNIYISIQNMLMLPPPGRDGYAGHRPGVMATRATASLREFRNGYVTVTWLNRILNPGQSRRCQLEVSLNFKSPWLVLVARQPESESRESSLRLAGKCTGSASLWNSSADLKWGVQNLHIDFLSPNFAYFAFILCKILIFPPK